MIVNEEAFMITSVVFVIGLSIFFALFVAIAWMQITIRRSLKKNYNSNPNILGIAFNPIDHSARQALLFFKFIMKKQYNGLNNAKMARDCNVLRALYVCYLLAFVWVCLSVVLLPR